MTVVAAWKLKQGCVLAVDQRIVAGSTIVSETHQKWCVIGPWTAAFAGTLGGIQETQRLWWQEEPEDLEELLSLRVGSDWTAVIYDREQHVLLTLDNDGATVFHREMCTTGLGQDVAWGFMSGGVRPKTLGAAGKTLRKAIACAAARDVTVNSQAAVISIPRMGHGRVRVS